MGETNQWEGEEKRGRSHGLRRLDALTASLNRCVMLLAKYWWISLGIVAALMVAAWIFDHLTARDLIGLGAFTVGVAALVSSRAVANDAASRTALGTFFQLVQRYESPSIADARVTAIESRSSGETDDIAATRVFNAFEYVGLSARRGFVEPGIVWEWIGSRAMAYWFGFQDCLHQWRSEDPAYFSQFGWLVGELQRISEQEQSPFHDDEDWINRILSIDLAEARVLRGLKGRE